MFATARNFVGFLTRNMHCDPVSAWEQAEREADGVVDSEAQVALVEALLRSIPPAVCRATADGVDTFERIACRRDGKQGRGSTIFRVLKRLWIPLLVLVVAVAGGFTVSRLHGIFGSDNRPAYADTKRRRNRSIPST